MVLLFKLGIAIICGAAYVTLSRSNLVASLSERRFQIFIALLWLITRLGLQVVSEQSGAKAARSVSSVNSVVRG